MMTGNHFLRVPGGAAVTAKFTVTVRRVLEDGTEVPLEEELAAALDAPAEQFAGLAAWTAEEAGYLDHADREKAIGDEGRELQRLLLQAAFDLDAAREERAAGVTSAAGIGHGSVEKGHGRGLASVFGPVRVTRMAYRNRREPNVYPADARQVLPDDPYSLGMRTLAAFHLAGGGFGQAQEVIEARTGVTIGRAQLAGIAEDLAGWTDDFYAERARDAEPDLPDSDVIMMQGDGKGIAMRPEHRKNTGKEDGTRPGVKKMAEIVAVADFTPAVREPEDIAAAFDEADRRDPQRVRQRVFLVDGNKQQLAAIEAGAEKRGLKVPVLIDYIHVSGYLGKAAAALHPGDPVTAGQWADGQLLRVLHGRAKAVAATLASVAKKTLANPRTRHPGLTDVDKAVTYLANKPAVHEIRQGPGERVADRHGHDRGRLQIRHRRQIRNYRREMVSRRCRDRPQDPCHRRQRRPRRLHALLQAALPRRTPPQPLRRGHHRTTQPRRMTEKIRNRAPFRKTHPVLG
jgi:hypothetical protein